MEKRTLREFRTTAAQRGEAPKGGEAPRDGRRGQGGRRRRRNQLLAMAVCFVVLVGVMYGCLTLFMKFHKPSEVPVNSLTLDEDGNVVQTGGEAVPGGDNAVEAASGAVMYSQEELDAKVAEAVLAAQEGASQDVLNTIRTGLSEGETVLETLRPFYPDEIIVVSGGTYHFVPINRELAQSSLLTENLNFLESGEVQYMEDGQVISHKGIDVSKHQGEIDWNLVAADGVEFAFIRVGNRGYGTGELVEDDRFEANIQGALAAGIKVGVYIYSQAITEEEALEEANFVLEKIAPYKVECPVVFDVEKVSGKGGRMNNISVEERTRFTQLFCQTIANAGYRPMIYHNTEMGALMLDLPALEDYDKWFAAYSDTLYYPYEYKVWQYSQSGSVQGVSGQVDLNISFAPLW